MLAFIAAAFAGLAGRIGAAQTPAEFYKGKTVSLYIGYSVGGGYDIYGRIVARHIGRHIPGNPTVVPRNMEGAGSLRAANLHYQVAPKDGTAFTIIGRSVPFASLFGHPVRSSTRPSTPGSAAPMTRRRSAPRGTGPASRPSTICAGAR